MTDLESPEHRRQMMLDRLEILDAVAIAVEQRDRVVDIVGNAGNSDVARARLSDAFGWNEIQATAVLDLQFRRLAEDMRQRISAERDALLAQLDAEPG